MHFAILVEEPSAEVALQVLVPKIAPEATFQIHPHQGKPALLGRLVHKLRGYAAYMKPDWRIVVLVDRDREDCVDLKKKLAAAAVKAGIPGHVLPHRHRGTGGLVSRRRARAHQGVSKHAANAGGSKGLP